MKNILITGGAGFIGYHLAVELSKNSENQIVLADNLQRGRFDAQFEALIAKPNVKFEQCDLTNRSSMAPIWKKWDEIYHLAAIVGVKHCMKNPERVLYTNLQSTINMIEMAKETGSQKFLFSSTCENYASGFDLGVIPVPSPETVPLVIADVKNPRLSYAGSKIVGEQMTIFNAPGRYQYKIVRYHNVFGPRMGYAHVVPEVLKRIHAQENPFKIFGADQTRAFCYVQDAVEQTILAMEHSKLDNEIVHIGNSSQEIKISDVVEQIFSFVNYNPMKEVVAPPQGSVNRRCPDVAKMNELTGFTPKFSLSQGLKLTVDWYWKEIQEGRVWE